MYIKYFSLGKLLLLILIIGSWGISLLLKPPQWKLDTIFYPIVGEEKRIFDEKRGLDTSSFKFVYYNKTTTYFNRYWHNFYSLLDINSYFFAGHPREDVPDKVFRPKLFWILIFPFFVGLWRLRISWKWLIILLLLSILKDPDGWDFILVIPIIQIIDNGFNNLKKLWPKLKK